MIEGSGGDARFPTELVGTGGVEPVGVKQPLGSLNDVIAFFHPLKVNRSFYFCKPGTAGCVHRY